MTEDQNVNREIAEKLGWTAIRDVTVWVDGDKVGKVPIHGHSGVNPQNGEREVIPDYTHSLDAVFAIPLDEGVELEVRKFGKITMARVSITVSSRIAEANPDYVTDPNPAMAAALAMERFLKWKASQS